MRERGDRRGAIIRNLKAHTSRLLAVILIGQNLFLSAASASATTLATGWFGARYGVIISVLFSTIALFIFAEMTPKAIGAASPVAVSRAVAIPLSWMMKVLSPLAEVCVKLTNGLLRIFGTPLVRPGLTEEELKSVFNLGADEGVIHRDEKRLLHKVVEFGDKTVRDIMVPRTKIVALPETASFADVRALLREQKLSRLPVYRGSIDNVVGVLNAKDLFDLSDADEQSFELAKYVDPPFLVPEFKRAEELFREMRRRHTHMAIVVDEHGGTAGLATIEDAIEALLGQIQDEYDEEQPEFVAAGDRNYLLDGSLRLDDLEEQFGIALPRDEAETIAGHLMLRFGRIPRKAERWKGRFADFVIEDATPTAIRKVRMILPGQAGEKGAAVSPTRTVTLIRGDGIGPEVADAVVAILEAARAPLAFEEVVVGREAEKRDGDPLPASALDAIRKTGLALKGPVGTPIGKGFQSVNVRLRQTFELYANLRPVKNVPVGRAASRAWTWSSCARTPRTSTAASSTWSSPAWSSRLKIITEVASTRIARFAFEYARGERPAARHGRPQGEHHEAVGRALPRLLPQGGR
jgi:putative hemolysin